MKLLLPATLLALSLGCESGTSENYKITVSDSTSLGFSPQGPGVLRLQDSPSVIIALCGDTVPQPIEFHIDHGFGCLDDALKNTEVERKLYIQPAPEAWDFATLCSLEARREGIALPSEFESSAPPESIEAEWFQTTAKGTWHGGDGPCGGVLDIEASL